MRLKKSWQAILWEELSVSGSISLALILLELWVVFCIHLVFPDWKFYVMDLDVATYFFPGLNSLLLMLVRGNQGELRGGFQRRLLFFPTHVITVVSLILFTRLLMVLLHVVILRSVCIHLLAIPYESVYGDWRYVYTTREMILDNYMLINLSANGCIYLLFQFLFWVFHWSKPVFVLILLGISGLILKVDADVFLYGKSKLLWFEVDYDLLGYLRSLVIGKPLEVLLITTLVIWHLSLLFIKLYRHNMLNSFSMPSIFRFERVRKDTKIRTFSSPWSALLWYEFKSGGWLLLKTFIALWSLVFIGDVILSEKTGIARLLSFDLVSIVKYYSSLGSREFALIEAPFIALLLAVIYYWLRITFRYGFGHPRYFGSVRFLPIDNFERVNAYLFVLSVNVFLIAFVLFIANLFFYIIEFYSNIKFSELFTRIIEEVFSGKNLIYYFIAIEGPLVILAQAMFLGLIVFIILASKEVLVVICGYLLVYGIVNTVAFYNSAYIMGVHYPLGRLYEILAPWVLPIENFLNPIEGNYSYFYIILLIYFLYLILKYRLLKVKEILFLLGTFGIVFVSIYPWLFDFPLWKGMFFQIKLHLFLASAIILSYFSNLLSLQGFKWRNLGRQVVSTVGITHQTRTSFFWMSKIPLMLMVIPIFIFRIDPWYLTDYGLGDDIEKVRVRVSKPHHRGVELRERFEKLIDAYEKNLSLLPDQKEEKVMFVYNEMHRWKYWEEFFRDENRSIPQYVYTAMIDFYNEYGMKITTLIREFIETSKGYSEDDKDSLRFMDFDWKWKYVSSLCDMLMIEAYIRGISGDYEGMLNSLKDMNNFSNLIYIRSLYGARRIWGIIDWYLTHTEVPLRVIDEFERLLDEILPNSYEEEYELFKIGLLIEISNLLVPPREYWNRKDLLKKYATNNWYETRSLSFLSKSQRNIAKLIMNLPEFKDLYSPLLDILTLERHSERNREIFYYVIAKEEWENFLEKRFVEPYDLGNYSLRIKILSSITYPLLNNLRKLGLALEKYRIKFGELPETLEVLVPEFIDELPCDPWNKGMDISYKKLEPLGFCVYSYFRDFQDDGGFSYMQLHYRSKQVYSGKITYDEVFLVPPLPFRHHGFVEFPYIDPKKTLCSFVRYQN